MTKQTTLIVAALAVLSGGVFATAQEYVNMGIGGGGGLYTPACSPHDPQLMMVTCDMGGAYISRDSGQSWKMLDWSELSNARNCMPFFDPNREEVIFAASGSVLKKSEDSGETWHVVQAGGQPWGNETVTHIAAPKSGRKAMYLGTAAGLYQSADGGDTWKKMDAVTGVCGGLVAITSHAYAAFDDRLLHSIDGGETWQPAELPVGAGNRITALSGGLDPAGKMVILVAVEATGLVGSEDLGRTWHLLLETPGLREIAMAPDQVRIAYTADDHSIWRTTDAGATWEECFVMEGDSAETNVRPSWVQTELRWGYRISPKGLGVCGSNANLAMVSTQGDLYITRDGGNKWYPAINESVGRDQDGIGIYRSIGLEVTSAWQYLVSPWRPKTHYIAFTDIGFMRSLDRGETWKPSSAGSPWRNTFYQVLFDPFKAGKMYAAASNQHDIPHWTQIDHVRDSGGVVVSTDHGDTWKVLGTGMPEKPCTSIALVPGAEKQPVTLYAALYGDGVYKSTDGGKTWERKSNGLCRPGNNHVFMVKVQEKTGSVYCSVTAAREGSAFPVPGGLWKSDDAGESWYEITKELNLHWAGGFDFDPRDGDVIYLTASTIPGSSEGGLYKTADGGESWTRVLADEDFAGPGLPGYVQSMFVNVSPHDPDTVYLSTVAHGLWISIDAGETWARMPGIPFASISNVCFAPRNKQIIYVTTFGGAVWKGPAWPANETEASGSETE